MITGCGARLLKHATLEPELCGAGGRDAAQVELCGNFSTFYNLELAIHNSTASSVDGNLGLFMSS